MRLAATHTHSVEMTHDEELEDDEEVEVVSGSLTVKPDIRSTESWVAV